MKKTLIALSMTLASGSAMADTGFYVGGNYGVSHSTYLNTGSEVGGFAGYEWNKILATEVGYEQYPGGQGAGGHAHAIKLDLLGTRYFDYAQTFGMCAFFGINNSGATGMGSGFGYDYGLGLRYNVSSNIDTRLRVESVQLGSNSGLGYNITEDNIGLGIAYHF